MTKATTPSGSIDEAIAFRQGVSVVTIKDQLTGMLPKFSAGTRSRIVIDGNAPDSDVYYDDSMVGLGPGTIVPTPAQIFPVFLFDHDFSKFEEIYNIEEPGIFNLQVSGSYTGKLDATFRIQIANPDDDDVYTISSPVYDPIDPGSSGLNDLSVVVQNITEINDEGEEAVLVSSGSYDMSQGISVYKVEIATAEQDAVDTIRWYKNGELLAGSEEVITAKDGNELIDGNNKIVVKFEYDGYEDIRFGAEAKHTPGDSWTIVAGTQQIRWSKGEFDSQESATLQAIPEKEQAIGGPVGILQSGYQLICDGVYIKLPSQIGYPDGSDPNVEASLWQFDVTSLKPEAAITAMQDAAGKIQIFPDHRTEQRDFGQPKFHNDFDVVTIDQQQVSTVEVLRIEEIGQQNPNWVSNPGTDINALPRTPEGNTRLYSSAVHGKRNLSYEEANLYDASVGIPVDVNLDPLKRTWQNSSVSDDGSVGPYFTVRDLRGKQKKSRNNHFWFNFGYTTTSDITKYDDKNPSPQLSDPIGIDISGRDLSAIEFFNQPELSTSGEYEVYNIPAILPISQDLIIDAQGYWSNDAGVTMVSAADVHPTGIFPTSINSSGNTLYYLASSNEVTYKIAATVGWSPDIDEDDDPDVLPSRMSNDIYGNALLDPVTGIPTPLEQDAWMSYHGYSIASIDEIPWMQREGYVAYEDALHDRYFTLYDEKYQGYYVQLNVTDNLSNTPPTDVEIGATLNADQWLVDGNKKSKGSLKLIRIDLNRFDTASAVSEKIIDRINKDIPLLLLDSAHPFYSGTNCSLVFVAKQDENDAYITKIQLVNDGKIQDSEVDPSLALYDEFQVYTTERGSLGYAQNILKADETTTAVIGNCICLYTSTAVGALPAGSPFVIWFNLNGTSLSPEQGMPLWSYSFDSDYEADISSAFAAGNSLEILMFPDTPARTLSYMVNQAIQNNVNFLTSFMPILSSGSNVLRIMQRDPGLVETPLADILDQTCHNVNSEVTVSTLRSGIPLTSRDRDYISDSIVFAVNDPKVISERFFAEKRVVRNYAHFQVNCVAEEKSGLLFDYSNQEWVDPDPDVGPSLAKILKGGKAELSNYEPNIVELFNNIPQKEASGTLIWKRIENSTVEIVATAAGFDLTNSNYDSKNRILWADNLLENARTVITTSSEQGLEDDEMSDAGWSSFDDAGWENITENEWMTFEGYLPVPAFTHKIAQASYFLLPHPEKNFYIWFDVGQLSADPGDDGALDDIVYFDQEGNIDRSYIGGGVRIALDSYDTAGIVAQKLVDRINSDRHDTKKVFVQINVNDDGEPEYQALDSGNINKYFDASINQDDSSIVDIICKIPGLINTNVFEQNNLVNFPITESGDEFSITLIDNGDTDYYVDITNSIPGFLVPPATDVVRPDADAGMSVTVTDIPYSPAQPGLTKTLSSFLPYEDMNSMSRGYRKTLEDGTEIALAGPVAYIEDDTGSLMYPVIMSNVSMKDPDQYDGVIEPLEIRSRASRNSPDAYFVAHDIKGELQSDVASDSRKRSNPITQFINNAITKFEPYEDGIEHMESSPSVESFVRTPVFNGAGINDLSLGGVYSAPAGSLSSMYYVECVTAYDNSDITPNDKFRWKKNNESWSEVFELENTEIGSSVVITFDGIRPSTIPEVKTINVPAGSYGYTLEIYAQGDINSASEFYTIQYLNEQLNPPEWTPIALQVNDLSHPLYTPNPVLGSGYVPGRYGYSPSPHITITHNEESGVAETIPLIVEGSLKIRVLASTDVNTLLGVKNNVKIATNFLRTSGYLSLDYGLYCVFDNKNGHTAGDSWVFEAVSKTHYDSVGYLPFPGYLTWQESKVDPFVESSDPEESTKKISDNDNIDTFAISTMAFNYDGFSSVIPGSSSTWEVEYLRSLNGQAFTLNDTEGTETRFEFDNDNVLENDGDVTVPLLRNESLFIRFPDVEKTFQKRDAQGNLLWLDFLDPPNSFAAYATAASSASDYLSQDGITNLENYDDPSGKFSEISEAEWAQYYNLLPDNVAAEDICPSLVSVTDYAGKYFIITDEVNSSMENINNTLVGGRYAVWFNVIDANTDESISSAPTFLGSEIQSDISKDPEDNFLLYWDEGTLKWDVAINLGYPEAGYEEDELTWSVRTGYYSTRSIRKPKWSNDNGKTILCPMGEIIIPVGEPAVATTFTGTLWDPDPSTLKMGTDSSGNNLWSNDGGVTLLARDPALADPEGYERMFLSEESWHEYEEYENYSHLIPQLIEVTLSSTDSVNILVKKTVKAINSFKNANQAKVFSAKYIHPPEYTDLYDLNPADAEDAVIIANDVAAGGTWVSADYDDILHVKLENDWFYQYAMDPSSPPNLSAFARGWQRGFISIKISSKNVGYHNITSRLTDAILPHEPLYTNIPSPASTRSFTMQNNQLTEWGGYHTFEELLHITSQKINSSNIKISSEVLYSSTLSQLQVLAGDPAVLTPVYLDLDAANLSEGIVFTFDNNGGLNPEYNVFASSELIPNNFVRFKNYIDDSSRTYVYKDYLPGLKLTQGVSGRKGNKKNKFHHYKDDKKGNIILSNFQGGTSTGPHVDEIVINMYPGSTDMRPYDHKSSAAGMIYNDMPCGTDSITFGGWKK